MRPFCRSWFPWALSCIGAAIVAGGITSSCACGTTAQPRDPGIEWRQLYLFVDGSIEAHMGSVDVGFSVFLPQVDRCRAPIVRSVSTTDIVTVFRGPDVRSAMPLGGAVPSVPASVRVDTATGGSVRCEARITASGEQKIILFLENIQLGDMRFEHVGPVEGRATVPPP